VGGFWAWRGVYHDTIGAFPFPSFSRSCVDEGSSSGRFIEITRTRGMRSRVRLQGHRDFNSPLQWNATGRGPGYGFETELPAGLLAGVPRQRPLSSKLIEASFHAYPLQRYERTNKITDPTPDCLDSHQTSTVKRALWIPRCGLYPLAKWSAGKRLVPPVPSKPHELCCRCTRQSFAAQVDLGLRPVGGG